MALWKRIAKKNMKKHDQIWYGDNFGFYIGMQKIHITITKKESRGLCPYGCRKGQQMVGLWNPHHHGGGVSDANVFIPKNKIKKVMRSYT